MHSASDWNALIDITSKPFELAYKTFITTGDFIGLTAKFELGFQQTGVNNGLNFRVKAATVYLIDSGILVIEPDQAKVKEPLLSTTQNNTKVVDKNIIISSGIHGNETAPIEIVQQLISEVISQQIQIKNRCLFIIGNPVAMNIAQRFHTENLNRLFCGKHQALNDCFEKTRAEKLERYVTDFFQSTKLQAEISVKAANYHYDLHTAIRHSQYEKFAIYPFRADHAWQKEQLAFLASCGVNTILFSHAASGTFSYFTSSNFSAHSFTIELGKVKTFGENDMANFSQIIIKLREGICGDKNQATVFNNDDVNLFKVLGEITKHSEDFELFIADNASNFTSYPVGTVLSSDQGQQYRTTQVGESVVFPNKNVGCGQRAALIVIPTTLD